MKKLIMIFAITLISNIQISATEISNYGAESNLKGVEPGWQWKGELGTEDQWVKWNSEGYTSIFGNLGNFEPKDESMGFDSNPVGTVRLEKMDTGGEFTKVCQYKDFVPENKDIGCGYSSGGGQKNTIYRTWGGWDSGLGSWFKIKSGLD